jgi:hypothetical protein
VEGFSAVRSCELWGEAITLTARTPPQCLLQGNYRAVANGQNGARSSHEGGGAWPLALSFFSKNAVNLHS